MMNAVEDVHRVTGRFFEDFECGASVTTASRTIGADDVQRFAVLTGDASALHMDEDYARGTAFGGRIVHGALVFSVSIGLTTATGILDSTLIALSRIEHLRFARPVHIGDSVTVVKSVIALQERDAARGLVTFDTRVRNQHHEVVVGYVDSLLVARRPMRAAAGLVGLSADPLGREVSDVSLHRTVECQGRVVEADHEPAAREDQSAAEGSAVASDHRRDPVQLP